MSLLFSSGTGNLGHVREGLQPAAANATVTDRVPVLAGHSKTGVGYGCVCVCVFAISRLVPFAQRIASVYALTNLLKALIFPSLPPPRPRPPKRWRIGCKATLRQAVTVALLRAFLCFAFLLCLSLSLSPPLPLCLSLYMHVSVRVWVSLSPLVSPLSSLFSAVSGAVPRSKRGPRLDRKQHEARSESRDQPRRRFRAQTCAVAPIPPPLVVPPQ